MKFRVVLLDAAAFLHRAAGGAHPETQVPKGAGEFSDQRAKVGFRLLSAEKKQEVKVGIGEKHFTTVSTQRQQTESLPGCIAHPQKLREDLLDGIVGKFTQLPQRVLRARAVVKQ